MIMESEPFLTTPFHQHIRSLPNLVEEISGDIEKSCRELFQSVSTEQIDHIYITGCGDSFHAAICARLSFLQCTGINCTALSAMEFSRYQAAYLSTKPPQSSLVIGVSASGRVSRTIEALNLARQAKAITVALTGNQSSPLARIAEFHILVSTPLLDLENQSIVVPGSRSYVASLLGLYFAAIAIGLKTKNLSSTVADSLIKDLNLISGPMNETIVNNEATAIRLVQAWQPNDYMVFCGAGPSYGSALFSAAKLIEATGAPATAQDLEEWAHLEYFTTGPDTPTVILGGFSRDKDRAQEIVTAARQIGRRLAIIAPNYSDLIQAKGVAYLFPLFGTTNEAISPLLATLPSMLIAASCAAILDEPYFRGFGGGRSIEGGGGISRIRTSKRLNKLSKLI